ncbi:MAG: hypothetical protein R3C19_21660 [Planctomycetaceae bacterium]
MNTIITSKGRNVVARLLAILVLAAAFSGCQSTRDRSVPHPFTHMFDGYDYAAPSSVGDESARADEQPGDFTNADLVRLTESGADVATIISQVQTHGGRFEITDPAVSELESAGVSDEVVTAIKRIAAYSAGTSVEQNSEGVIRAICIPAQKPSPNP